MNVYEGMGFGYTVDRFYQDGNRSTQEVTRAKALELVGHRDLLEEMEHNTLIGFETPATITVEASPLHRAVLSVWKAAQEAA